MKQLLLPLLLCLLWGCAPADPNDKDSNGTLNNGRLTLPTENLKVSPSTGEMANSFYAQIQGNASTVLKDFYFNTPGHLMNYQLLQSNVEAISCDAPPVGHYYLIDAAGVYTEVQVNASYSLAPNTNYRLQFRADNLNCYAIRVNFTFRQF